MKDGKSLEKVGVIPDKIVLKKRADFQTQKDPVLVAALASFGINISAEDAGKVFPDKSK